MHAFGLDGLRTEAVLQHCLLHVLGLDWMHLAKLLSFGESSYRFEWHRF
jgi:hypothetical protein